MTSDANEGTASGRRFEQEFVRYLRSAFPELEIEEQFPCGESLKGTHRRVDVACFLGEKLVLVIECKYQGQSGTTDDKIRHAEADLVAIQKSCRDPLGILLVYGGEGWCDKGRLFGHIPFAFEFLRTDRELMARLFDEICLRAGLYAKLRKNRNQLTLLQ